MIKHILFDLDSTLYSVRYGLEDFYFNRLREFVASYLGVTLEEAKCLQQGCFKRYGTTIEWLTSERSFTDIDGYYAFLHPENEVDCLSPDPDLGSFLKGLPCPCSILTNAPAFHANRVIKKLELEGIFRHVFDIRGNGLKGKPHASAFFRALDAIGQKPEDVLFIDDVPRYVEGCLAIGGKGVLLDELDIYPDYPHERVRNLKELTRYLQL